MGETEIQPENRLNLEGSMDFVNQTQNEFDTNTRRVSLVHQKKPRC